MDIFKKVFLFTIGIFALAYEEAEKTMQERRKKLDERRKPIKRQSKVEA